MSALLLLELRSIILDQRKHDREQAAAREEQLKEFDRIARGIDRTIHEGETQFRATSSRMEDLMRSTTKAATLARDSIDSSTGGTGFCYLNFMLDTDGNVGTPVVVHDGRYPLYDVDLRIVDLEMFEKKFPKGKVPGSIQEFTADDVKFHIGDLSNNVAYMNPSLVIRFSEPVRQDFRIFFSARNGYWTEDLSIKMADGRARQAWRVRREFGKHPRTLFQKVDKAYPLVDGQVDWRP